MNRELLGRSLRCALFAKLLGFREGKFCYQVLDLSGDAPAVVAEETPSPAREGALWAIAQGHPMETVLVVYSLPVGVPLWVVLLEARQGKLTPMAEAEVGTLAEPPEVTPKMTPEQLPNDIPCA